MDRYPQIRHARQIFEDACSKGLTEKYGDNPDQDILDRYNLEKDAILKNGFHTVYLVYRDAVSYLIEKGSIPQVCGQIGDTLIAYILGITNADPIAWNLPAETCLSYELNKEPEAGLIVNFDAFESLINELEKIHKNRLAINVDDDRYKFKFFQSLDLMDLESLISNTGVKLNEIGFEDYYSLGETMKKYTETVEGESKTIAQSKLEELAKDDMISRSFENLVFMKLLLTDFEESDIDNLDILDEHELYELPISEEGLFNNLVEHQISKKTSFEIVELLRHGEIAKNEEWKKLKKIMSTHEIPRLVY